MGLFGLGNLGKKRVLVIDDEKPILEMLAAFLTLEGYDPILSVDAVAGIEMAARKEPNLIIMDVQMEPIGGLEAIRRIRSNPKTAKIPCIIITGADRSLNIAENALDSGANFFLPKPIDFDRLKIKIESLLPNPTGT